MPNYYRDDFADGNEQRLRYFDSWFKTLAARLAKERGETLSHYLSQITNLTSFKAVLSEVFSLDASLASYVDGMSNHDFKLFFDRSLIQEIVEANEIGESEKIEEEIIEEVPVDVEASEGEAIEFFRAQFIEKATGKKRMTVAKEDEVTRSGKKVSVLRDAKGRFVKRS